MRDQNTIEPPKWGVVSTIKAPTAEIVDFCAHHLDLGAHRLFIFLDDDNQDAANILASHPKIRVTLCNGAYWAQKNTTRPEKHQQRQTVNAMVAYRKRTQLDWMTHIDVDEFLWPHDGNMIASTLGGLPDNCQTARLYPIESLAPLMDVDSATIHFKSCHRKRNIRTQETTAIYPNFGSFLNGGYLSHVQGKLFYRTGIEGLTVRIHNAFLDGTSNPNMVTLDGIDLCHMHATSWSDWYASYRYRHENGSYRPDLKPVFDKNTGGLTMHQLFQSIEENNGQQGLKDFFTEVCTATPSLLQNLASYGHLRTVNLELDSKRRRHFPDIGS